MVLTSCAIGAEGAEGAPRRQVQTETGSTGLLPFQIERSSVTSARKVMEGAQFVCLLYSLVMMSLIQTRNRRALGHD